MAVGLEQDCRGLRSRTAPGLPAHLPWPSICQKPHISWAQQQLQWNWHLKVILPQGEQHVQEPSSLPSL